MAQPSLDRPITLTLSPDAALVLFELLSRAEASERLGVQHPAEEAVLTQVLGRLERHLVTPFAPDYRERLAAARVGVEQSEGRNDVAAS